MMRFPAHHLVFLLSFFPTALATATAHSSSSNNSSLSFDPNARFSIPPEDYDALDEANSTDPLVLYLRKTEKKVSDMMSNTGGQILESLQNASLSASCSSSIGFLLDSLKHYEPWAFQMMDASSKIPEGIMTGSISSFGNYDSCLAVKAVDAGEILFTGKYCAVIKGLVAPLSYETSYLLQELPKAKIIRRGLRDVSAVEVSLALQSSTTRVSYCFPSTCNHGDVRNMTQLIGQQMDSNLSVAFCETKQQISNIDSTQVVMLILISILVMLSLSCSIFDIMTKSKHNIDGDVAIEASSRSLTEKLLVSWSLLRSYQWISRDRAFDDRFPFVYGIRFLAIMWVFWAYSYAIQNVTSIGNTVDGKALVREWIFQLALNGTLATESFVFVSGFMSALCVIRHLKDKRALNMITLMYLMRIWRTLPVILFAIICAIVSPIIASGPVWREMMNPFADKCRANWFPTALFYNNFAQPEDSCLIHLWFNAMDTQLFLVAPIMAMILVKRPKFGTIVLLVAVCFSIGGTAVQIVKQSLPPVPLFYINSVHFLQTLKRYIFDLYFLPMQHLSAFAIGSGTAVFISSQPKIYMRNEAACAGWILSFGIKFGLLFAVKPWNSGSSIPTPFMSALYGSTCRTIWSLTHCWDFVAASTGYGGFLTTIFSWKPLIPLSRMTFTAHTFGPLLMLITSATNRAPYYFTHFLMFQRFCTFLPMSYAIGFVVCLLLEGPLALSSKILLQHFDHKNRKSLSSTHHLKKLAAAEAEGRKAGFRDQSFFQRVKRLPKISPANSYEIHAITRVN